VILDTSAVIAMLLGEPEAQAISACAAGAPRRAMSAATWLEAAIVADNRSAEAGRSFAPLLDRLKVEIVPFTADHAALARAAHARFGRGRHAAGLNLGDCFAYALAQSRGEPLLFKGDDFRHTDVKAALSCPNS
jgi:ribonuclease VapC